MAKLLFHALVGSENPTRACFTFLQAVANKERGDDVKIALVVMRLSSCETASSTRWIRWVGHL